MNTKLAAFVGTLCMVMLVGSGASADKPDGPPKPDKTPGLTTECIIFSGDLESAGDTRIEGCCPNAGPWPAYEMNLATGSLLDGTHAGQLFINFSGTGPSAQYKVQFWTWDWDSETPGDGDYFFEIVGGEIARDRKAKTLTVTFDNEAATGWIYGTENLPIQIPIPNVSFELFRTSDLIFCEE